MSVKIHPWIGSGCYSNHGESIDHELCLPAVGRSFDIVNFHRPNTSLAMTIR